MTCISELLWERGPLIGGSCVSPAYSLPCRQDVKQLLPLLAFCEVAGVEETLDRFSLSVWRLRRFSLWCMQKFSFCLPWVVGEACTNCAQTLIAQTLVADWPLASRVPRNLCQVLGLGWEGSPMYPSTEQRAIDGPGGILLRLNCPCSGNLLPLPTWHEVADWALSVPPSIAAQCQVPPGGYCSKLYKLSVTCLKCLKLKSVSYFRFLWNICKMRTLRKACSLNRKFIRVSCTVYPDWRLFYALFLLRLYFACELSHKVKYTIFKSGGIPCRGNTKKF